MSLSFVPIGIGDAFSAVHYSSSLAIEADGRWILLDCPHPIRKVLRESGRKAGVSLDVGLFDGVILTHLHSDHVGGLEGYAFYARSHLKRRTTVVAHPAVVERLWDGCLSAGMESYLMSADSPPARRGFDTFFEAIPLSEERPTTFGPFQIECRRTIHHLPTTALRMTAGGASIGYSADTAFDRGLIDWLARADLVIHETNVGFHTPYAELAALPADLRSRMRLIHCPDDFDRQHSAIEPLEEGRRYLVAG